MERELAIRFGGVEYGKEGEVVGGEVNPKVIMEMGKLPSSQYKGVVPQPNGRWGAQIYEQHQRVWLGTFDSEAEAAKSYDLAAISFKGTEALTNFNPITVTDFEEIMEDGTGSGVLDSGEREHMFDKVVTPSDVGKLNRLVIPKQHAEKYFPLDSTSNEKGLLLNFDDNTGKQWRFRYSYWNSSQSYVMTKGWSRFVKEKKLDAGDTVSFQRGVGQAGKNRFYIGWKRRPEPPRSAAVFGSAGSWGQFFWPSDRPVVQESNNFDYCNRNYVDYSKGKNLMVRPQQLLDLRSMVYLAPQRGVGVHGGEGSVVSPAAAAAVFDSVPVVHERRGAKKHLRLFGVNLECPMDENRDGDGDGLSSPTGQQWFTQTASPSQLQLRLYNGASSQLPLPTVPQDLTSKARPSWSFDLEP